MMKSGNQLLAAAAGAVLVISAAWRPNSSTGAPISAADSMVQDEIILARQGLMEAISGLMNEGEIPENDAEAGVMQANAEAVALSLPALKFLFPVETNPQNPNFKASYRTYALPAIWRISTSSRNILMPALLRRMRCKTPMTPKTSPPLRVAFWKRAMLAMRNSGLRSNRPSMPSPSIPSPSIPSLSIPSLSIPSEEAERSQT
jgi:hypothetical protein